MADAKISSQRTLPLNAPPLFQSKSWTGAHEHHQRIAQVLEKSRAGRDVKPPVFIHADVNNFDFGRNRYNVIVCCGSVLSFIDNYANILEKMAGTLNDDGLIFLEVEQKRNMDLIWPIVDNLTRGKLGYEQSWAEIWKNLFSPRGKSIKIDYPFELHDGHEVILPIWLFSVTELGKLFKNNNLCIKDRLGIHWATNILPSTYLHKVDFGDFTKKIAETLMFLDGKLGHHWPMWRCGCSVIYCLAKG